MGGDKSVIYKGIIQGRSIQVDQQLPYTNGQAVNVSIELLQEDGRIIVQRLLDAIHAPPHLAPADVDEMERFIKEGSLPIRNGGVFDHERD